VICVARNGVSPKSLAERGVAIAAAGVAGCLLADDFFAEDFGVDFCRSLYLTEEISSFFLRSFASFFSLSGPSRPVELRRRFEGDSCDDSGEEAVSPCGGDREWGRL
jgi:hypothetical protein